MVALVAWATIEASRGYGRELRLPLSGLSIALAAFWGWLGITLLWHPVPQMGILQFWVLGAMPLAYGIARLAPDREATWRLCRNGLFILALLTAAFAAFQFFAQAKAPRSVFLDINSYAAFVNLIALPAAGMTLAAWSDSRGAGRLRVGLGAGIVFFLLFAVFLTKGRAASLALAGGTLLVIAMAGRQVPSSARAGMAALAAGAFLLANLAWQGELAARVESLFTPASAGADRFIIWREAWRMLQENPWSGVGIGTFWLAWPRWRHPDDTSGGFFVHNDYLQIWIEAGIPGLVLLLVLLSVTALRVVKALGRPLDVRKRLEIAGLGAGLGAVAFHAFFNFNLYMLPILLAAGLALARLEGLTEPPRGNRALTLRPDRRFTPWGFRSIVAAGALVLVAYFSTQGAYFYLYRAALEEIKQGRFAQADATLLAAARMAPLADNVLTTHADLMRRLIRGLPEADQEKKQFLYRSAEDTLDRARKLNPLRASNYLVRGELYHDNPPLAGPDWAARADFQYREALRHDPRSYRAREALAALLLQQGARSEARRVLEEGLRYWYYETADILPYYELARRLREQDGDREGAAQLAARIKNVRKAYRVPGTELLDPAQTMERNQRGGTRPKS
ncbi:MAG: O-antigen ligase family protein [Betaproteobacteria bacterium]|nr:O-antigen ligase family protein [Betaproteobacteria bacterium]